MTKFSFIVPILNDNITSDYILRNTLTSITEINTDYEIVCVNSTGKDIDSFINTLKRDYEFVYINKKESERLESFNVGIYNCSGEYVIPVNAGNKYVQDFNTIYNLLDKTTGIYYFGNDNDGNITFDNYVDYTLCSSSIIFNKQIITQLPFLYEEYYDNAELKLMLLALDYNIPIKYIHTKIISNFTAVNFTVIKDPRIERLYNYKEGDNLTCIIPFKNEGYEVERTVQSIRATTDGVKIILINDKSDDGYNYKYIAERYNCKYIYNDGESGSGPSKQLGIDACDTECFILLDAHMRFYEDDWDIKVRDTILNNPKTVFCLNTIVMHKKSPYNNITNEHGDTRITTHAAFMKFTDEWNTFDASWAKKYIGQKDLFGLRDIAVILGATYCCTKTWWNYIRGYEGLIGYGLEEPFISMKCWMMGGRCAKYDDVNVGHMYRDKFPYIVLSWKSCLNRIVIMHSLFDEENLIKYSNIIKSHGEGTYNMALKYFNEHKSEYDILINDIKSKLIKPMSYFIDINSKAK